MTSNKSVEIKGKHNLDALLNKPAKRLKNLVPIIGEEYTTKKMQIQLVNSIYLNINTDEHIELVKKTIYQKLLGYKSQDRKKTVYSPPQFISFESTIQRLVESRLKCFYCNCDVNIIYSKCRQKDQWTLDRIDNTLGHNTDNILISCLGCNLKRRDMDKDKFFFTQNLQIKKLE